MRAAPGNKHGRVTVRFTRRDDGGLQAKCDEVPGFYLSGADARAVMRDVVPALETILQANLDMPVSAVCCIRCDETRGPDMIRRFVVCQVCGNKRCPHATDHREPCTDSNEPEQPGSDY